jgi:hypothetical protein
MVKKRPFVTVWYGSWVRSNVVVFGCVFSVLSGALRRLQKVRPARQRRAARPLFRNSRGDLASCAGAIVFGEVRILQKSFTLAGILTGVFMLFLSY